MKLRPDGARKKYNTRKNEFIYFKSLKELCTNYMQKILQFLLN